MEIQRYIVHVDMDAFFAAVEQRDRPAIRNAPVVIGADPKAGRGRGVVSTCNYAARRFGIHSAMPISRAYQLCPAAVFLPPDMEKYSRESESIFDILYGFTPLVEPVGIDEAFLDISGSVHLFGSAHKACAMIKKRIKESTGLTASVGLAPTKMAAKIASDLCKPDGFLAVTQEGLLDFLWPLPVEKIWGLGKRSQEILNGFGITTIGHLAKRNARDLEDIFGKNGAYFRELAWGRDCREVEALQDAKSISNEMTFEKDTRDREMIKTALLSLSERISCRLRRKHIKARTITVKIRVTGFQTFTRAASLNKATNFSDQIYTQAVDLFDRFDAQNKKIRLIGVKVSQFCDAQIRDSIFVDTKDEKKERIHCAIDLLKDKFGPDCIRRAARLGSEY